MKMPDLGKKIGPFPLYVWLIAVAGGLGLYFYLNRATGDPGSEDELTEDTSLIPGVGVGAGAGSGVGGGSTGDSGDTNEEWAQRAVTYLIDKGTAPLVAQAAINNYLNGETLTVKEFGLINLVLLQVGRPPSPPTTVSPVPDDPNTYEVVKYTGPALRKDIPSWRDGKVTASRNYTWAEYLDTHYTNVAPKKTVKGGSDVRYTVQQAWLRTVNPGKTSVKKGMVVRVPKKLYVSRPPSF